MKTASSIAFVIFLASCAGDKASTSNPTQPPDTTTHINPSLVCDTGNGGITLPSGFCATVFTDQLSTPRHIVVTATNDVYIMQSGGSIVALRDTNSDGHADVRVTFGRSGNSGLALNGNDLYADISSGVIVRYHLTSGVLQPASGPDTIVRGIPTGGHGTRSIAVDGNGNLFINVGSASNVCEGSTRDPCGELPTRAGIWRFSANNTGQTFSASNRFAAGIRNAVGITISSDGRLFATQHGRDNLQNFPQFFSSVDGAENPGEELLQVNAGDDFGWPYCYYDMRPARMVLAPEYGGDRQTVGRCANAKAPLTAFPGHWAPNGMVFYNALMFPAHYRDGAFIAFHGSWNRAPQPQAGYLIAFVSAAGGSPTSTYEIFANGFAGTSNLSDPNAAAHRPTGLAVDANGALFIGDDWKGRIWRVVYRGQ